MGDVVCTDFLNKVNAILAEKPSYRLGGSAADGTCDCIGLTIGALRRAGGAWAGTHGSNFAARYETEGLSPITTQTVYAGMQVYKAHERGESGYALPGRYAGHADTRDYYHSGIVLSASPLQIGHVTTPGAAVDLKMGKWRYGGALKKVAYEGQYPNQTTKDTALLAELKALVLKYSE